MCGGKGWKAPLISKSFALHRGFEAIHAMSGESLALLHQPFSTSCLSFSFFPNMVVKSLASLSERSRKSSVELISATAVCVGVGMSVVGQDSPFNLLPGNEGMLQQKNI